MQGNSERKIHYLTLVSRNGYLIKDNTFKIIRGLFGYVTDF